MRQWIVPLFKYLHSLVAQAEISLVREICEQPEIDYKKLILISTTLGVWGGLELLR